jgi:hypothetical protein
MAKDKLTPKEEKLIIQRDYVGLPQGAALSEDKKLILGACPCGRADQCPYREDGKICFFERQLSPVNLSTPRDILNFLHRKAQFDWLSYVRMRREEALGALHRDTGSFGNSLLRTVQLYTLLSKEFGLLNNSGETSSGEPPIENDSFKAFADWWKDENEE